MGTINEQLIPIDRSLLEQAAAILGPFSACAQALADADRHDGPVQFFRLGKVILVHKAAVAEQQTHQA